MELAQNVQQNALLAQSPPLVTVVLIPTEI